MSPDALDVVPVSVAIANQGVGVHLAAEEQIPAAASVVAAPGAQMVDANHISWQIDLPSGETATLSYLIRLPDFTDSVYVTTTIDYELAGTSLPWGVYSLTLAAQRDRDQLTDEAIAEVSALSVSSAQDRQRKAKILDLLAELKTKPPTTWAAAEKKIKDLTQAAGDLAAMDCDTHQARIATDKVLSYWERKWSK
jgi:hypothetical protein